MYRREPTFYIINHNYLKEEILFQVASLESYDIEKYGVEQTVEDNCCPGKTFSGIRTIPILIHV